MDTRDRLDAALVAIIALCLNLFFLSKAYVFEGLARAMPIELGRFRYLFGGNYLLYGPLGWMFHGLLGSIGFHPLAVISLQIMDSLIGAAGIFVFFLTLRRIGADRYFSVAGALVLASCLGYWIWSTDAENYILSTFLLTVNFYFLVRYARGEAISPITLGLLQGLAMLGHIVNGLFIGVALWIIIHREASRWKPFFLRYLLTAFALVTLCYSIVVIGIEKIRMAGAAFDWLAGSAATGHLQVQTGGAYSLHKMLQWVGMSVHIVSAFRPVYTSPPAWSWAPYLLVLARMIGYLFLFFGILTIWKKERAIVGACAIWILLYAIVFTRWQPFTMVYRVSDLIPICTFLVLSAIEFAKQKPITRPLLGILALLLVIGNGSAEIYPRHSAGNNPLLQRMLFFGANTPENAWIAGGNVEELYIPYFALRRPIVVDRFRSEPRALTALFQSLIAQQQSIYTSSDVIEDPVWSGVWKSVTFTPIARAPDGAMLYRLDRRPS